MKITVKNNKVTIDFEGDTITTENNFSIKEFNNDGSVKVEILKGHWVGNGGPDSVGREICNVLSYYKGSLKLNR